MESHRRVDTAELKLRLARFLCPVFDSDMGDDNGNRWTLYWSSFSDFVAGECSRNALDGVAEKCFGAVGCE